MLHTNTLVCVFTIAYVQFHKGLFSLSLSQVNKGGAGVSLCIKNREYSSPLMEEFIHDDVFALTKCMVGLFLVYV